MPERDIPVDIITITGHRDYPDRAALYRGLDQLHGREYVFGGGRGVDTDALEYLGRTQPGSLRTVVVPNRVINQAIRSQAIIKQYSTMTIELRNTGLDRYMIRNRWMVNHSTKVAAFYDFRGTGGTKNTMDYANYRGVKLETFPLIKFDKNDVMKMSEKEFRTWTGMLRRYKVPLMSVKGIILEYMRNVGITALSYWFPEMFAGASMESVW